MAVRRGDEAREAVKNKIIEAFGSDFITLQDKKIIVQAREGSEILQFAITLTMPKAQVTAETGSVAPQTSPAAGSMELSPEDAKKIAELRQMLGIQ